MGKGAGSVTCRQPLVLGDSEDRNPYAQVRDRRRLMQVLKNPDSYVDRVCAYRRLQELSGEVRDETEGRRFWKQEVLRLEALQSKGVEEQLEALRPLLEEEEATTSVLAPNWRGDLLKECAMTFEEYRASEEMVEGLIQERTDLDCRLQDLKSGDMSGEVTDVEADLEMDEGGQIGMLLDCVQEELISKEREVREAVLARDELKDRLVGYIDYNQHPSEYHPGEFDLSLALDHQKAEHQEVIDATYEKLRAAREYELIAEIEDDLADARHWASERPQDADWQMQDLAEIEADIETHNEPRAILLEKSLFDDHLLYAERLHRRVEEPYRWVPIGDGLHDRDLFAKQFFQAQADLITHPQSRAYIDSFGSDSPLAQRLMWRQALMGEIELAGDVYQRTDLETHFSNNYEGWEKLHHSDQSKIVDWIDRHHMLESGNVRSSGRWVKESEPTIRLFGECGRGEAEEQLVQNLIKAGAIIEDHAIEIPDYRSRHIIEPGQRFALPLGDNARLHYIPHTSIGSREVDMHKHTAHLDFKDLEVKQALRNNLMASYADRATTISDCYIETNVSGVNYLRTPDSPLHSLIALEVARRDGEDVRGELRPLMSVRTATLEDFQQEGYYEFTDGTYLDKGAHAEYQQRVEKLEKLDKAKPIELAWHSPQAIDQDLATPTVYDEEGISDSIYQTQLRQAIACRKDIPSVYREIIAGDAHELSDPVAPSGYESTAYRGREPVSHQAPFSERGRLVVEGLSVQEGIETLQKLDITQKPVRDIPAAWVFGRENSATAEARHHRGRITPPHREFATKPPFDMSQAPGEGSMVMHGMTGCRSGEEVVERLGKLVDSGGIQSIAERRRMGITAATMSPRGDIASGIDRGVPCAIGSNPAHGARVFFGLRPEILERRDLWFSPRDFGSSDDRYEQYTAYANQLGQKRIYQPTPYQGRKKHLESGLGRVDNEVYFRDRVGFKEIDTIFVEAGGDIDYRNLREQINQWKREGKLPERIRVKIFGLKRNGYRSLTKCINQRARKLAGAGPSTEN